MATIPDGYRPIEGSERRPARGARRVGPADPSEKFSFTIRVRRRPDAPPLPDQKYWAANPPGARVFLSREELVAQSSAAQADLDKVTEFVRSQGFEVVGTSVARRTIRVSGTVDKANRAFAVDLGRYESPEQKYRGREGPVHLPAEVADVVEGVFGLDNRRMVRRAGGLSTGAVPLTPLQVAKLYNFPPLNAAGQTIGIIEVGGGWQTSGPLPTQQNDLQQFCTGLGVPTPTPTVVSVDGASTNSYAGTGFNSEDLEVAGDVGIVASVAQGANIVLFFTPLSDDGVIDAVTTAIYESPLRLTVLFTCNGNAEDQWSSSTMNLLDIAFSEAALLGMTILAASGDLGSNDGDNDGSAHADFPASDPWVTACGGTFIDTTVAPLKEGTFTEGTWNDAFGATGGGVSLPPSSGGTGFPVPFWQNGLKAKTILPTGTAPLSGRGVPDVAGNASGFSGYNIILQGQPTLSVSGGRSSALGGTSVVVPLYAALIAIIAAKAGWPIGFLNPLLYQIGNTPGQKALVPVKDDANNQLPSSFIMPTGDNATPCTGFVATGNWNACTGWGRINGNELLKTLVLLEETRPITDNYPFSFGAGGEWLYHDDGGGSSSSGDEINAGQVNTADPYDCTYLYNNNPNNAVLAADNQSPGNGAVGLFGRSRGSTWSIGVAGESQTGCAVYGIATGNEPSSPNAIGVVGRSMGGIATETLPLEQVVGEPIGVLGHSANGPGVRGHGGVLLKQPQAGRFLPPAAADPGGVFSSGRLHDQALDPAIPPNKALLTPPQTVSLDSLPQLRLVPSVHAQLPATAEVGDFFLVWVPVHTVDITFVGFGGAQLFVCTGVFDDVAQWQQVTMGSPIKGGTTL
jgi:kumamolisin